MNGLRALILAAALTSLCACAQPAHYEWGSYEQSLYSYYKNPAETDKFTAELAEVVQRGEAEGRVAPGLHAEYGYMLLAHGQSAAARAEFETEKQRWPESAVLMDQMIKLASDRKNDPNTVSATTK